MYLDLGTWTLRGLENPGTGDPGPRLMVPTHSSRISGASNSLVPNLGSIQLTRPQSREHPTHSSRISGAPGIPLNPNPEYPKP